MSPTASGKNTMAMVIPTRLKGGRGRTQIQGRKRRGAIRLHASSTSALMKHARETYESGNKMGALEVYEKAEQVAVTTEERQEALYGKLCCLAAAGQVDSAKATLRCAIEAGMDFQGKLAEEDSLRLEASTQMRRLLDTFAQQVEKQKQKELEAEARAVNEEEQAGTKAEEQTPSQRLQALLQDNDETGGLDTSAGAIAKRVGILVAIGVVMFPVLYFGGMKLVFMR